MSTVQRSILFSAVERYASLLLFLVSTAVLSRLLTPKEFGIYAVVGAVTSVVAGSSQEFGGANYLIQKASLSEENVRTAFTITFGLSVAIGAALYLLGGVLGTLFGEDALKAGISVAVLNFVVTPFSMTMVALLRRNMQFGEIAASNLAGNFATVVASIALAAMGYSYLAPIWGMIVGSVAQTAYLIARRDDVRIFIPSLAGYLDVVRFGLYSSGVVLINLVYNSAPQVFLARVLDFAAVGLYSRATNVTQVFDKLVIQVISPVIMPAVCAQTNAGGDLKRIYLHAISLLTALQWPFLILMAVMAKPIISVWLGQSWLEVVPLVRVLCLAYLSLFAACLTYPVLVAVGSVRDALISSLISLPPSLLLIFGASFFGVEAVAASTLVTLPFQAAVAIYFVGRHLDLRLTDIVRATWKSGIVALCSGASAAIWAPLIDYGVIGSVAGIFAAFAVAAGAWLAAVIVVQHPLLPFVRTAADRVLLSAWRLKGPVAVPAVRSDRDAC
ncbi:oligosaccharide flippase family protein [Bradyrhizobium cenepequi]|uniref:oligosaccharide flippase family protein n=1 Tax=Bradyrhizobium cenepequi TaxID=2821403 RepID=UPI001CE3B4F7|nr:oligosaccharide flippase family protein [Bradyrhizobium cenepequi]MCA6107167.1 oligosaccharide flippase family protein [Bradyrhizobium cenepequi]